MQDRTLHPVRYACMGSMGIQHQACMHLCLADAAKVSTFFYTQSYSVTPAVRQVASACQGCPGDYLMLHACQLLCVNKPSQPKLAVRPVRATSHGHEGVLPLRQGFMHAQDSRASKMLSLAVLLFCPLMNPERQPAVQCDSPE
jgi:hypothetical protein